MATPRDRWPERAEDKRVEAKQLADQSSELLSRSRSLAREGRIQEANELSAEAQANSERIARLMAEARNPRS